MSIKTKQPMPRQFNPKLLFEIEMAYSTFLKEKTKIEKSVDFNEIRGSDPKKFFEFKTAITGILSEINFILQWDIETLTEIIKIQEKDKRKAKALIMILKSLKDKKIILLVYKKILNS